MELIKFKSLQMNFSLISLLIVCSIAAKVVQADIIRTFSDGILKWSAADIFKKVVLGNQENVILSPASIQTCLGMIYFGAGGKTEKEILRVLRLEPTYRDLVAKDFEKFVRDSFRATLEEDALSMYLVNKIFVNEGLQISPEFNAITSKSFESVAEHVNFSDSVNAVKKINDFVEVKTVHKIQNVLEKDSVNSDTSVVLINAIYFQGTWENPFIEDLTTKSNFAAYGRNKVPVDTMHLQAHIRYGEFPELDAKVIELPYKNSDISMMLLLPNAVDGLESMEEKLKLSAKPITIILDEILSALEYHKVDVSLPKFRIEYSIDLEEPLEQLGLQSIFSDEADFSELLENGPAQKVSEFKHKAFINVDEYGSEASAVTVVSVEPVSEVIDLKKFHADHPFAFLIRDSIAVYFSGHVVQI